MSCREYERWNPSRWGAVKVRRFRKHVRDKACLDLLGQIGETGVCLFLVWFNATLQSAISAAELHARGVTLIGDTDGNTGAAS